MENPASAILALLLSVCLVVHAQLGFVSIDCGKPANYSSNGTGAILYTSDASYIDTGENHQISLSTAAATLDPKLKDLRSFPKGKRNCYALPVIRGKSYLVRAYFLYGNYDGLDAAPQFDLHLGTNLWSKVSISNASRVEIREIIAAAVGNSMAVCLVETGSGKPFISALEQRPFVNYTAYPVNSTQSLITVAMINFGGRSKIRYPEDNYDRIWIPYFPPGSASLSSPNRLLLNDEPDIPSEVMQTAAIPITGSTLNFSWPVDESRGPLYYHIMEHFAELQSLNANESRIINFAENGVERITNYAPTYLDADSWWSSEPHLYSKLEFSFSEAPNSSLPPTINAMEIFQVGFLEESFTDITDVEAMGKIRSAFRLRRNWIGDPCAPKNFLWDGLRCVYAVKPYRIFSLDLSNSGLVGTLPASLANLSELQFLDLSSNKLSGGIPSSFAKLSNIKFLNIRCSGLNGSLPKKLQDRAAAKLLNIVAGPCFPTPKLNLR